MTDREIYRLFFEARQKARLQLLKVRSSLDTLMAEARLTETFVAWHEHVIERLVEKNVVEATGSTQIDYIEHTSAIEVYKDRQETYAFRLASLHAQLITAEDAMTRTEDCCDRALKVIDLARDLDKRRLELELDLERLELDRAVGSKIE